MSLSRWLPAKGLIGAIAVALATSTTVSADERPSLLKIFVEEFVSITPGKGNFPAQFEMGSDDADNERPPHTVRMQASFEMAKYEVPQNLYQAVMGKNPSRWKGPRNSVEMISWQDANHFCKKITQQLHAENLIKDDEVIRLPTEAEWEYCCRAGTTTRYSFGNQAQREVDFGATASILNDYGWHTGNAAGNDPPVGKLKPNPWGLYDMHGYLWEFTSDTWSVDYKATPNTTSADSESTNPGLIAIRGGSWKDRFEKLTSSARRSLPVSVEDDAVGFRCVKSKRMN